MFIFSVSSRQCKERIITENKNIFSTAVQYLNINTDCLYRIDIRHTFLSDERIMLTYIYILYTVSIKGSINLHYKVKQNYLGSSLV